MENGTWIVRFSTPMGGGAGVVILNDGKLRGGDSMMTYIGSYNENAGTLNVEMKAIAHTAMPGMAPVFGVDDADISLTGRVDGMNANLTGTSPQAVGVRLTVTLQRYCD